MLKKKEWLRQVEQLLYKSELFDNFDIQVIMKDAGYGRKEILSPEFWAEFIIGWAKELGYIG
jgi:hypothetical protein